MTTTSDFKSELRRRMHYKFFFDSTPPSDVELSVMKSDIEESDFFSHLIRTGANSYQSSAPPEVLQTFLDFIYGDSPTLNNGFEYIRFGLEIEDTKFMRECCLNCSSLEIPELASPDSVIKVFTSFVEAIPLRSIDEYEVLFEQLSSWEEGTCLEVVDRILNILEEKKKVEVPISPLPLFTSRITVAVLRMMPGGENVFSVLHDTSWWPLKIFGEYCPPGEVNGQFHLVFSKYILLFTEDKKIVRRSLKSLESSTVFEDADYFRSHFGKCLVIRGEKLFLWNEELGGFEERYSDSLNMPLSACADSKSGKIRIMCKGGNSVRICRDRIVSFLKSPRNHDWVEGKSEAHFLEGGKLVAQFGESKAVPLGDLTHLGWTTLTVSKEMGSVYGIKDLPSGATSFCAGAISFSDVFVRL